MLQILIVSYIGLMGTAPPTQKLTGFVHYLKVINTFLKTDMCIL